jgi:hypothetical protein
LAQSLGSYGEAALSEGAGFLFFGVPPDFNMKILPILGQEKPLLRLLEVLI